MHDGIGLLFFERCVEEQLFDEGESEFAVGLDRVVESVKQVLTEVCSGEDSDLIVLAGPFKLF